MSNVDIFYVKNDLFDIVESLGEYQKVVRESFSFSNILINNLSKVIKDKVGMKYPDLVNENNETFKLGVRCEYVFMDLLLYVTIYKDNSTIVITHEFDKKTCKYIDESNTGCTSQLEYEVANLEQLMRVIFDAIELKENN